jgi:hypothetical protein
MNLKNYVLRVWYEFNWHRVESEEQKNKLPDLIKGEEYSMI